MSAVISEARREASRRNGSRSRGPKTEAGKARSRANSLKHGLTGAGVVLPEDMADAVARYRADLLRRYAPRNPEEAAEIDRAAGAIARLERLQEVDLAQRRADAERAAGDGWDLDRLRRG